MRSTPKTTTCRSIYFDHETDLWLQTLAAESDRAISRVVVRLVRRAKAKVEAKRWQHPTQGSRQGG